MKMSKLNKSLLSAAIAAPALAMTMTAQALPTFTNGVLNTITSNNVEIVFRPYAGVDGTTCANCLAHDPAQDPAGYRRADPFIGNNIIQGDVITGIINIDQNTTSGWTQNVPAGDTFRGYFAQQVASVSPAGAGSDPFDPVGTQPLNHINLTSPVGGSGDPFGILQAGEQIRLYTGVPGAFSINGATLLADVIAATSGAFWGSFGSGVVMAPGVDTDGFFYAHADVSQTQVNFVGTSILGLNAVNGVPLKLAPINSSSEGEMGGFSSHFPATGKCTNPDDGLGGNPTGIPGSPVACTDIIGEVNLTGNQNWVGVGGGSQWAFQSGDDINLVPIPEPATLALLGMGLLGFGAARRRSA